MNMTSDGDDAINALLNERRKTHGDYNTHAAITQSLKLVMHTSQNWTNLSEAQAEALDMIAHKIGRILAGDPDFKDHWSDLCGYARLVEQQLA